MKSIESLSGIPRKVLIRAFAGVLPVKVFSFPFAQEIKKSVYIKRQDSLMPL
jgi:hypothetical protein